MCIVWGGGVTGDRWILEAGGLPNTLSKVRGEGGQGYRRWGSSGHGVGICRRREGGHTLGREGGGRRKQNKM